MRPSPFVEERKTAWEVHARSETMRRISLAIGRGLVGIGTTGLVAASTQELSTAPYVVAGISGVGFFRHRAYQRNQKMIRDAFQEALELKENEKYEEASRKVMDAIYRSPYAHLQIVALMNVAQIILDDPKHSHLSKTESIWSEPESLWKDPSMVDDLEVMFWEAIRRPKTRRLLIPLLEEQPLSASVAPLHVARIYKYLAEYGARDKKMGRQAIVLVSDTIGRLMPYNGLFSAELEVELARAVAPPNTWRGRSETRQRIWAKEPDLTKGFLENAIARLDERSFLDPADELDAHRLQRRLKAGHEGRINSAKVDISR